MSTEQAGWVFSFGILVTSLLIFAVWTSGFALAARFALTAVVVACLGAILVVVTGRANGGGR